MAIMPELPTVQAEQSFFLPWPVSTNSLWRAVKGRNILAGRARAWHRAAAMELSVQKPKRIKGPVRLSFSLSSPTERKYDIGNFFKIVEDLLVAQGVIEADYCDIVKAISIELGEGFVGVKVTVTPL